jgi:carboxypeptidase T
VRRTIFLALFLLASLILALGLTSRPAPAADNPFYQYDIVVVRAYYDDPQMAAEVFSWTAPWEVHDAIGYLVLEVTAEEYQRLLDAGFRLEVDEKLTAGLNQLLVGLPGQVAGIPGYPCYRTVEETFATAQAIVANQPQLASWLNIGVSWEKLQNPNLGYNMMVLRLTNAAIPGPKPTLFIMAALHARELTTAELVTRFGEYLVDNYGTDADATWLLDYHDVHLLLQANPDGRKRAETGLSWRKNSNNNYCANTNSRGIDLNRNFDFLWGCCGGSSGNQCDATYRGPSPASEPETQAIQEYINLIFPDQRDDPIEASAPVTATGVFLDVHSYSELVLWPWGFTSSPTGNDTALRTLGRKFAYYNSYMPQQAIGLYPTDGTTDDYAYGKLGIAPYTFELGTAFFQACSAFENTILPDNLGALIYAAKVARTPYLTPAGPDALNLTVSSLTVAPATVVTLTATLNDTRFSSRNGIEPVQNIAQAEYYLNAPPWITTTTPVALPMVPVDGSFNSPVELAQAAVDTTGLAPGRHTLYVRGQDTAGNWGAVSAQFLYVIDPDVAPIIGGQVIAADTGLPLVATISGNNLFQATSDPLTGFYMMQVISNTYDLVAVPEAHNYASASATPVAAPDYQTVQQDFVLQPYCNFFFDDMESGVNGWTAQAPWARTSQSSYSPIYSWTDSPAGNYGNNVNVAITSPIINLTGASGTRLNFWHRCSTEAGYDYCRVEVSTNGGSSWTQVAAYDGINPQWQPVSLAVPMLDNQPNARLRFRLTTDSSVTADGWYVDDVAVTGIGPACIAPMFPGAAFTSSSPDALSSPTSFINMSTGSSLSFAWDLGDGSGLKTERNPIHSYTAAGDYTVTLTATNELGSDTFAAVVSILQAPQAGFIVASPIPLGQTADFTNNSTGGGLSNEWDFGDGSPTSTDTNPSHLYAAAGTYTVTLTTSNVVDSDVATAVVTILQAPQAGFTVVSPVTLGQTTVFTNTSSGSDLSYQWNFGDDSPISTDTSPSHLYGAAGTYTVTLTVTNEVGSSMMTNVVVVVAPPPFSIYLPGVFKP